MSKFVNNKSQIIKKINQKGLKGSHKCFSQVLACHVLLEEILLGVI